MGWVGRAGLGLVSLVWDRLDSILLSPLLIDMVRSWPCPSLHCCCCPLSPAKPKPNARLNSARFYWGGGVLGEWGPSERRPYTRTLETSFKRRCYLLRVCVVAHPQAATSNSRTSTRFGLYVQKQNKLVAFPHMTPATPRFSLYTLGTAC